MVAICIVLAAIFIYGFIRGDGRDRMRLTKIEEKRGITLVVSMPDVDANYEVLHVEGCAAEVTENGTFCLAEGWSTQSDRAIWRNQEPFPFPDCPRGAVMFQAWAKDQHGHVLASSSLTLLRGW